MRKEYLFRRICVEFLRRGLWVSIIASTSRLGYSIIDNTAVENNSYCCEILRATRDTPVSSLSIENPGGVRAPSTLVLKFGRDSLIQKLSCEPTHRTGISAAITNRKRPEKANPIVSNPGSDMSK